MAQTTLTAHDLEPFVGSWTLDPAKSAVSDPERRIITLGPAWVRIELHRPGDAHPPALVYNLDGSPNVNPFGAGTATTEIRKEPNALVTSTVFTINDRPVTVHERLQITSTGEMTASVILRVEHGYQGVVPPLERAAPNVSETLKYFRKSP
jgi:hypothetical protein